MNADEQQRLITALTDPKRYPEAVDEVDHHETHSSHILLAGDHAYKIKKSIDLGFLDFSTLELRHHYCQEELRLNRRLAPIYLDVVAITGTPDDPVIDGDGEAIEWAVKMQRFDQERQLDHWLEAGKLTREQIETLACRVADFHAEAPPAAADSEYGTPAQVAAPMRENFEQIRPLLDDNDERERLERLERWTEDRLTALDPVLQRRLDDGRVRECHGDMHLANMIALDDGVAVFDGIEFNAGLRWIDVASEIAFVVMDLDSAEAPAFASRFLDQWLAHSGDYDTLAVLRLYLVYRAMVRAKVAAIRLGQEDTEEDEAREQAERLARYIRLAERYADAWAPGLALTHGIAGTGKSTAAAVLIDRHGAVRLRADVERRRLYPDPDPATRYAPEAHDAVYAHLETLAAQIIDAGYPVVIDATFIERKRRAGFARLAAERDVPFVILDMQLPQEVIEQRIAQRQRAGNDPSEADRQVMLDQQRRREPLTGSELDAAIAVDNTGDHPVVPPASLAHARGLDDLT